MAYSAAALALLFSGGSGAAKSYVYVTADPLATVLASGYFNSAAGFLKIGDTIEVRLVDVVAEATRAAAYGMQTIMVATNDLTTVTTTSAGLSTGSVVDTTATTLALTRALHHNKTVTVSAAAALAVTLPQATGSGNKFRLVMLVAATGTAHTIKVANATDIMIGYALFLTTSSDNEIGYATTATDDTISLNGTTKGGLAGDIIEIEDVATGKFAIRVVGKATGTTASPFSATV